MPPSTGSSPRQLAVGPGRAPGWLRLALAIVLFAAGVGSALVLAPRTASAQAGAAAGEDVPTRDARRHFQNGLKLFADKNFVGALAEFDAAYRLKPGPSSLKNIALCQKALFRYADAIETLHQVLARHDADLSTEDRQAVKDAIAELESLVGTIVVRVSPDTARVFVDGRATDRADWSKGIRLNTGEHVVVAEAAGYAKASKTIRVAGGQKGLVVDLSLQPSGGFVSVDAADPKAAIAIDRKPVAFARWSGPLDAGRHYVQIYREGYAQYEQIFWVEVGKTVEIKARLEPKPGGPGGAGAGDARAKEQRGWYALGVISALGLRNSPQGIQIDESEASGSSFGVRAGYRLFTPIAVELLLEGGKHDVTGACDERVEKAASRSCSTSPFKRDFTLESIRLGPNLRIMSGGDSLRFTSTIGAGAVRHQMDLDPPKETAPAGTEPVPSGEGKGWDPYFLLEVGLQYNWGHVLLELDGLVFIDGASNVKGTADDGSSFEPFKDTGGLLMGGIGIRAGWSEWSPK